MDECLTVQMHGTSACDTCYLHEQEGCGGKNILATGKNAKNITVTESGLDINSSSAKGKKKKKKKKKKK